MVKNNLNLKNTDISYSQLLKNFAYCNFTEEEAKEHWQNIVKKTAELSALLNRDISISAVIADYFTSASPVFSAPFLIEEYVFRNTEKMALADSLTGLFNRRYMELVLAKEIKRAKRYDCVFSICMLDIDNFKRINDKKGHQFGDTVLQNISQELQTNVREEDIVCRYGGEEFLIILPQTCSEGAQELAERLRKHITSLDFFKNNHIQYSTGVSHFNPTTDESIFTLIDRADKALYKAKFNGKNKVCVQND